ncbi:hypothetical protein CMI39_00740 [Candidatus Pacearchaeota archaeon]|jgi:hypothetical protein|nr:hypothetical protein [Candidatus Pacearchaeota archaeon]|tara:strand:- start:10028 stop:10771 length:744 start_codon:yes stop_codon:yes gene_type:complete
MKKNKGIKKSNLNKILINLGKGILLIFILWLINVFIAFVIFKPVDEHTKIINISWLITDIAIYTLFIKLKQINWQVNLFALLTILFLIGLYLVPINNNISLEAREINNIISNKNDNKYDYAKELFYEIEKNWDSPIRQYLLEPHKIFFIRDFNYFWNVKGYVDSKIQAQIYQRLLIDSKRFDDNEVILKQKWCVNSPHGMIIIKHSEQDIYADFWAVDGFPRPGIPEEYNFGQYAVKPCNKLEGVPY